MWKIYVMILLFIGIIAVGIYSLIKAINEMKAEKAAKLKRKELGSIGSVMLAHVFGLPISRGVRCDIHLFPDKFLFLYGDTSYCLNIDKIADVSLRTERQLKTAFGPLLVQYPSDCFDFADANTSYLAFVYDNNGNREMILLLNEHQADTRDMLDQFERIRKVTKSVVL